MTSVLPQCPALKSNLDIADDTWEIPQCQLKTQASPGWAKILQSLLASLFNFIVADTFWGLIMCHRSLWCLFVAIVQLSLSHQQWYFFSNYFLKSKLVFITWKSNKTKRLIVKTQVPHPFFATLLCPLLCFWQNVDIAKNWKPVANWIFKMETCHMSSKNIEPQIKRK